MTSELTAPGEDGEPRGELVPFTGAADTHYEVALDDGQAAAEVVHPPGGFGLPAEPRQLRPVVPEHLRSLAGVRKSVIRTGTPRTSNYARMVRVTHHPAGALR